MPTHLDSALGIHAPALTLRAQRTEVLAANLANADTPNYKARDIDFRATLANAYQALQAPAQAMPAGTTHPRHIAPEGMDPVALELRYRQPHQASLDGNTVDTQKEHAEFMDNALRYQASLNFLSGKIRTLLTAIRGD